MGVVASSQESARSRKPEPVLITDAPVSPQAEHAARKRRYLITMIIRALSLVAAAIVFTTTHILWLVLVFAVLGTVLPWIAVVMANDAPPKSKQHVNRYQPERTLQNPSRPAIEGSRIIDG
jgi:Flp pilus assembly protein TadB